MRNWNDIYGAEQLRSDQIPINDSSWLERPHIATTVQVCTQGERAVPAGYGQHIGKLFD